MKVIGIDPGVHGAVAIYDSGNPTSVAAFPFPIVKVVSGKKKRSRLDIDACWNLLLTLNLVHEPVLAVIEDVNGYAGNKNATGAAGFVFGRATGIIEGMIVALGIPRHYESPSALKKHFRIQGKTREELKTASRITASRLFPGSSHLFTRVADDGVAEASLMARFGAHDVLKIGASA